MAGKADYRVSEYLLQAYTTSVGATPVAAFVYVPYDGVLKETFVTTLSAITTTDSTIAVAVLPAGVFANLVVVGTSLIATVTGAGIGATYHATHTGANRKVKKGDSILFSPSGGGGAGVVGMYGAKIQR
jgi:hypothetical protein